MAWCMEINPGIGIGSIKFGISEDQLVSILGKPDQVDEAEYVEGHSDWHRVFWYTTRNVHFTFNKEDDYRLGTITIMGSGYTLFGKELYSLPLSVIRKYIVKHTSEIPKSEDWTIEDGATHECLIHDGLGIIFWFDNGYLTQMQCGYLFEPDSETIFWPS